MCPECEATGRCYFKDYAESIASGAKNRSNLDELLGQALEVHSQIAEARVEARGKMCPNLNNIDPDYPGKRLL